MESNYVESTNFAFIFITGISLVLLVGITAVMIYFVYKYHHKRNKKATNIEGNLTLELTWTGIPVILVLGMFWYGYVGYAQLAEIPEDAMRITVFGKMWDWDFEYGNGVVTDTLYVPVEQPIALDLKSLDVNHSFYMPVYKFKMDVLPNKDNQTWFYPDEVGSWNIACAEYCGLEHSNMYTKVVVMPQDEYDAWFAEKTAEMEAQQQETLEGMEDAADEDTDSGNMEEPAPEAAAEDTQG